MKNDKKTKSQEYAYLLMDSRARTDTFNVTVFECCETLIEAKANLSNYNRGIVIVRYDVNEKELTNPKILN